MANSELQHNIVKIALDDSEKLKAFVDGLGGQDKIYFSFLNSMPFDDLLDSMRFHATLCAKDKEGRIAAYGHIERFPQPHKQHTARLGIAVSKEARGTGLAQSMMDALFEASKSAGLSKLWLSVHMNNVPAVRLYERNGFVPEGIFFDEERRGEVSTDVVSMARYIDNWSVKDESIPWGQPAIQTEEVASIMKTLHSGWLTQGRATAEFERRICEYTGARHAVVMNNGTSCLYAMFSLLFKPGDRVIFPAFTFVSTLNAALACGVEPVLVDIHPDTANIDINMAEGIMNRDQSVRGLVVVDIAGHPVDMVRLKELCSRFNVTLVEDAAEAIGSACYGKRVGGFGHAAMFSFHAAKLITTIEGGAVTTDDDQLAINLRKFRNHGESLARKFSWDMFGLNMRSTDLQSAIGLAQIEKLDSFIKRRNEIATVYREGLEGLVSFQKVEPYVECHPYMMFLVKLAPSINRNAIAEALKANSIFFREGWQPLHKQAVFQARFPGLSLPVSEGWGNHSICLPMYNTMSISSAKRVVECLARAIGR